LRAQLGRTAVEPLLLLLESTDSETRMKALQFLLYYAVDNPQSVDTSRIHSRMREEQISVILSAWISYLESSLLRNWHLLADLLTERQLGSAVAGIPGSLRKLENNPAVIQKLVEVLPNIPDRATRLESVRALSGRHPQASEALSTAMISDEDLSVRLAAVFALSDKATPDFFDLFARGLETDPVAQVRAACATAMVTLDSGKAQRAFQALRAKQDPAIDAAIEGAER